MNEYEIWEVIDKSRELRQHSYETEEKAKEAMKKFEKIHSGKSVTLLLFKSTGNNSWEQIGSKNCIE